MYDLQDFLLEFDIRYVLLYFFIANLIGFCSMGIDKFKAKKGYWRTPEGTLLMIALCGGCIGSLIGMYTFRHKTKKMKFTVGIPTILISEICIVIYIVLKLYNIV